VNQRLHDIAIELLKQLIAIPSYSREEDRTADLLISFFTQQGIATNRKGNNVWAVNQYFDSSKPSLLLNSHHDTVKPNPGYTRDPFLPTIENEKLYGLGSNDAGGSLVSLIAAFLLFHDHKEMKYNIVFVASAEEEISGTNGIELVWSELPKIDFAIVGEPTLTDIAVAEKGLLVLDCVSKGKAGHAAREEGINAIYCALTDIEWFRNYQFPKVSTVLGKIKMSVTVINAGQAHNQVPAECKFVVDIRVTDAYTLEEVLETVKQNVSCSVHARSLRLRSSGVSQDHILAKVGRNTGKRLYGSPTTSDQALIPVPSIKMGPGDSARSHSADEFIYTKEIEEGITSYVSLLSEIIL
jgi:acetylornithine deacetylase/succinyl-diaminopimelate desuccinylase-like protein